MKEKEDSGFGFKDRAKAEETLRLLEQHEPGYRRLTVRGLLGRAKRVLSLTKAEEKIKNIKEAMEVFENWLAELDSNKEKKPENKKKAEKKEEKKEKKKDSDSDEEAGPSDTAELPPEGVSGLGFKDPAAARASLEVLQGRDPDYQLLAVKGLLGRAKRVLTLTKDETKLSDIKAAMDILEGFTREYESSGMAANIHAWLRIGFVRTAHSLADTVTEEQRSFLSAYNSVRGEHKRLRNVETAGGSWDRVRNKVLKELREKHAKAKMFNEKDEPTKEHLEMILWAYSPDANRLKKVFKETEEEKTEKMDVDEENGSKRKEKQDGGDKKKDGNKKDDGKSRDSDEKKREERKSDRKRRSSARSDDESHSKKRKD